MVNRLVTKTEKMVKPSQLREWLVILFHRVTQMDIMTEYSVPALVDIVGVQTRRVMNDPTLVSEEDQTVILTVRHIALNFCDCFVLLVITVDEYMCVLILGIGAWRLLQHNKRHLPMEKNRLAILYSYR